jgi:succinyl-CoA synthetase beta subunit
MHVDPSIGFLPYNAREMATKMGFRGKQINKLASFFLKLWNIVEAHDVELTEINPLILTKDGRFLAADARLNVDDNALFRHKQMMKSLKRDPVEQNEREKLATENDMAYVELDGNIACICNGAVSSSTATLHASAMEQDLQWRPSILYRCTEARLAPFLT